MRRLNVFIASLILVGCTDLVDPETLPQISGRWAYEAAGFAALGEGCTLVGTLTLEQNGRNFDGTFSDGVIRCENSNTPGNYPTMPVLNGSIAADSAMSFTVDAFMPHTGRLTAEGITGSMEIRDVPTNYAGSFTANR